MACGVNHRPHNYIHTPKHTHTHAHANTYTHTHSHTHTHTRTHTPPLNVHKIKAAKEKKLFRAGRKSLYISYNFI